MRGHHKNDGNFRNLLELRSAECQRLKVFLSGERRPNCLSHDCQNKILTLMSHSVLNAIIHKVKEAIYFAVIADETTDSAGKQ